MTTKTGAKQTIAAALNHGGALLGHVIWWALEEARIDAATFKAAWTGAGLDEKYLPETAKPARALADAGRSAMVGQEEHLFLAASKNDTHHFFAILRKDTTPGAVATQQIAQIAVDGAGQFTSDHPEEPLVQAVRDRFDEVWGAYQPRDVRAAILALLKDCASVTLRGNGGVYYVPAPFAKQAEGLAAAIAQVGKSEVTLLPITADPEAKAAATLGAAAKGGIEKDLAGLREEMEVFAKAVLGTEGTAPRASTVERRLAEFEAIRSRAALYRDVLSVEVGDLDAQIASLEEMAQTVLTVIEDDGATGGEQAALPGTTEQQA